MPKVIQCECDELPSVHNGQNCSEVIEPKWDESEIEMQRDCPHADHVPGQPVFSLVIESVCQVCGAVVES